MMNVDESVNVDDSVNELKDKKNYLIQVENNKNKQSQTKAKAKATKQPQQLVRQNYLSMY